MSKEKISTSKLLQRLFRTASLNRFIRRFDEAKLDMPVFSEYIKSLCEEKGIPPGQIVKKADIDRTYGHHLFNGNRTPSRDKVIQLAFGFEMDYDDTQKLLAIARKSPLHPKVKRDAVIIYALKHGLRIADVQSTLFDLGMKILGKERFYE
jgi:transcriptional regulator with XRE-family HTH domain